MLYMIGPLQFEVFPLNVHEMSHDLGADFAPKDVIGAARPREFTGEADEQIRFSGRLFPHFSGGLGELEALKMMARSGAPYPLMRGDGMMMGWFLIDKLSTKSSYLDGQGIGRQIEFDMNLIASPQSSSPQSLLNLLTGLFE